MKKLLLFILALLPVLGFSQTDTPPTVDSVEVAEATEVAEEAPLPDLVETMPEYPGGDEELYKFIGKHLKYPKDALEEGIEGKVYVQFMIDKLGRVTNTKVLRGIGFGCDEEALRVIKKMPQWKPATQRGKPVPVTYTIPINFKLK